MSLSARVGKIGLGGMGGSGVYGPGLRDDALIDFFVQAMESKYVKNETLLIDTADVYGRTDPAASGDGDAVGHNERIIGQAIACFVERHREDPHVNESVCVLTKVGYRHDYSGLDFEEAHIRAACEQSLKNLQRESIDLYCLHREPLPEVWNQVLQVLAHLVVENKVKAIALSEPSMAFLECAYTFFENAFPGGNPLQAIETKFSLLSPNPLYPKAGDVLSDGSMVSRIDYCAKLGLSFIAYGVLEHGILTDKFATGVPFVPEAGDFRGGLPRFQGENFQANLVLRDRFKCLAQPGCTLSQLAQAWCLARARERGCDMVLIPGSSSLERFCENLAASDVMLSAEQLRALSLIAPTGGCGERMPSNFYSVSNIRFSPPLSSTLEDELESKSESPLHSLPAMICRPFSHSVSEVDGGALRDESFSIPYRPGSA